MENSRLAMRNSSCPSLSANCRDLPYRISISSIIAVRCWTFMTSGKRRSESGTDAISIFISFLKCKFHQIVFCDVRTLICHCFQSSFLLECWDLPIFIKGSSDRCDCLATSTCTGAPTDRHIMAHRHGEIKQWNQKILMGKAMEPLDVRHWPMMLSR